MKKSDGVPVVFRVMKSGQVIALMPDQQHQGKCASVREVVVKNIVEGIDHYKSIIDHSRPARASETTDLMAHFNRQGHIVSVRKKWTKKAN
jgi:hypothetical protein